MRGPGDWGRDYSGGRVPVLNRNTRLDRLQQHDRFSGGRPGHSPRQRTVLTARLRGYAWAIVAVDEDGGSELIIAPNLQTRREALHAALPIASALGVAVMP